MAEGLTLYFKYVKAIFFFFYFYLSTYICPLTAGFASVPLKIKL